MNYWHCPICGHEVTADEKPQPISWADGHTCRFIPGEAPTDDDAIERFDAMSDCWEKK